MLLICVWGGGDGIQLDLNVLIMSVYCVFVMCLLATSGKLGCVCVYMWQDLQIGEGNEDP